MSVFVFLNRELSFAYLERQQQRIHFHISIQLDSHTQERPAGSISSLLSLISHPASDFYFPFQLKSAVQQIPPDIRKMACLALCLRAPVQVKGRTSGRFTEGKETMGPWIQNNTTITSCVWSLSLDQRAEQQWQSHGNNDDLSLLIVFFQKQTTTSEDSDGTGWSGGTKWHIEVLKCAAPLPNPPHPSHPPSVDLSLPLQHCGETGGCGERTYLMAQECWLAASVPSEHFISSGKKKLCSSVTPFSLPPSAAHAHFRLSTAEPSPTRIHTHTDKS